MPDVTVTLTVNQAQRFQAACEARLLAAYIEDTGNPSPSPQELGEWCFKYLGRRFVLRHEREAYDAGFNPEPFEGVQP